MSARNAVRTASAVSRPGTLITSRPLDEYCGLFGLTRSALRTLPGPVLDCPGGAAALAAEARELGCEVIAADPLYALPVPALADLARAGRDAMAAAARSDPRRHLPAVHRRAPDKYLRSWDRARALFLADADAHPERYVAAALPALPFADGVFSLTLSSYLLFAYPELFPPAAQLSALRELVRVTAPAGEVRVYPLFDGSATACPHLPGLRSALGRHRIASEIRRYPTPHGDGRTHRVLILRTAARRRPGPPSRTTSAGRRRDRSRAPG